MPTPVTVAVTLQLLLAATFIVIPLTAWRTGAAAQRAAEAEIAHQGHEPALLAKHGIRFQERPWEMLLALAIAACLATLAALNIAGTSTGRILSFAVEPIVLMVVGLVTGSQVFATSATRSALKNVPGIDVTALISAAKSGFPSWLRPLVLLRFLLATAGSLLVIVMLATPAAADYASH